MEKYTNSIRQKAEPRFITVQLGFSKPTLNALEIIFEAFGQKHQAYTHIENVGAIEPTLRKLCDTIHIEEVITKEVSEERFKEFNIENIDKWNKEVINRFEGK